MLKSADKGKVVNHNTIRRQNYPYIFIWIVYYAWIIVFTTWWTASPQTDIVFGIESRTIFHSLNLVSSAVFIVFIKKEWFIKSSKIGVGILLISMAVFILVHNKYISLASAIITGITFGVVNTSILMPFVFTLNNTEKFYSVLLSFVLMNLMSLFIYRSSLLTSQISIRLNFIFSYIIMAGALSAVWLFKKTDMINMAKDKIEKYIPKRVYITLLINCLFIIFCKGIGKAILNITVQNTGLFIMNWHYIGGLIGCLIYFYVYAYSIHSIHYAWNITFGSTIIGLIFNMFLNHSPIFAVLFSVFLGISSTMGMINVYYIFGVIGKKYNSMKYIRLSIIFIGLCGGITAIVAGSFINRFSLEIFIEIFTMTSIFILMILLILSPFFSRVYYKDQWVEDSRKIEINYESMQKYKKYAMTNREIEVCELMLNGYTLKQISVMLSIAYSTVNTYATNIYRKLNINSRAELFILFKDYLEIEKGL
jgi:DNA-binding CsgD family transcriptional regulator